MDSAFYSCVDDTIEDAFDTSSDTEPADSDTSVIHLPSDSPLDSETRHSDVYTQDRALFAARNCSKTADWPAENQREHLSHDDILQGNSTGNSDSRLPTTGNLWLHESSAGNKCSMNVCDNVPLNIDRTVSDVYNAEPSRQRTSRHSQNLYVSKSDSSSSRQSLLRSKSHTESAKSHFLMSTVALPSSTNRLTDEMFLPDDKVMEIVEEQLENDDDIDDVDDDDESDGTDVVDDSCMVNLNPVSVADDGVDDSDVDSDVDEVEEISEDDEDRLADEERAVLEEAARAAAEAEAAEAAAAASECQSMDKLTDYATSTAAHASAKTTCPDTTADGTRESPVSISK